MWPAHALPRRRVHLPFAGALLFAASVLPIATFAQAGNFSAPVSYTVPAPTVALPAIGAIAVGAFTSNGVPDIVNADGDSTVSIWIGHGDGTFQSRLIVTAVPSTGPYSTYITEAVAVGDFNGDGNLDLAVLCVDWSTAPNLPGTINILLGDGTGHFGAPTAIPIDGMFPVQILAGHFDTTNNSNIDLAVLNETSESVTILLGNGDGTFNTLPDTSVGLSSMSAMTDADFNKDGKLDLAIMDDTGIAVLLGNGDGTFQAPVNWALPGIDGNTASPTALTTGDFNNDGNPDIAVLADNTPGKEDTFVFLGQGDGSFQSPPVSSQFALPPFASGPLATADFNSDGDLDLAGGAGFASPTTPNVGIDLGNGKGSFSPNAVTAAYSNASIAAIIATDLNGDSFPDLVVWSNDGSPNNAVTVLLNCGLRCTNTTVTSSATQAVFNQAVTFTATVTPANARATGTPTGTVTFQATTIPGISPFPPVTTTLGNATLSDGVATLTYSGLAPQEFAISASYQGDSNFNSSTSAAEPPPTPMLAVLSDPTTVALTSSADPSAPGQSVTFTATVTPSTSGVPTGTVTFTDNGNALVTQPLNSSGVATFTTSALTTGTHSITGTYSGDSNFSGSTSSAITQIVGTNAAPFAVSASPSSKTVSAGGSATFTITLATAPSAKSAISFSCSGLPMGANCSFSPAQITPKRASAKTTLTITTTGSGSVFDPFLGSPRWPGPALPFAFLSLLAVVMLVLTRKQQTQRAVAALVLLCIFAVLTGVVACGGNSSSSPPAPNPTPSGSSKITVTASANATSQTTKISLTVN